MKFIFEADVPQGTVVHGLFIYYAAHPDAEETIPVINISDKIKELGEWLDDPDTMLKFERSPGGLAAFAEAVQEEWREIFPEEQTGD